MAKVDRGGVYCLWNTGADKMYIGSSADMEKRKGEHMRMLASGNHTNRELQRDYDGGAYFRFVPLWFWDGVNKRCLRGAEYMFMAHMAAQGMGLYNRRMEGGKNSIEGFMIAAASMYSDILDYESVFYKETGTKPGIVLSNAKTRYQYQRCGFCRDRIA